MPVSQDEDEVDSSLEGGSKGTVAPLRIYVFDKYRLNARERRFCFGDVVIALPPKAFDLLHVLVEHAEQLIDKQTLLRAVWPDTFVEEGNLPVYISILRKIFNKESPGREFIETVPKSGYRFAVPATRVAYGDEPSVHPTLKSDLSAIPESFGNKESSFGLGETKRSGLRSTWLLFSVALAIVAFVTLYEVFPRIRANTIHPPPESKPLIGAPGFYSWPSFSPDGKDLAYAWRAGTDSFRNIFIQKVGSDTRIRLTGGGDNFSPAWSDRGDAIAFLHASERPETIEVEISQVKAPHVTRRVASINSISSAFHDPPSLSWSPDGLWLLTSEKNDAKGSSSLILISTDDGTKRKLTNPPAQTVDDNAVFSPDGGTVAFLRARGPSSGEIYVIPTAGGAERLVPFELHSIDGMTWSPDGQSLLVSSARALSAGNLWKVNLNGDPATPLSSLSAHTGDPTVSEQGHRLAYVELLRNVSLWRMRTSGLGRPDQLIASNFIDSAPDYSPDGSMIAFESDRSGASEIWICKSDGTEARRITNIFGPTTGSPRWSPDGRTLAFDSRIKRRSAVFVVSASGGTPTRVSIGGFDLFDNVVPNWSRDGKSLYFSSNRSGRWEIWKKSLSAEEGVQITKLGGFNGVESRDGRDLYYVRDTDNTTIWKLNLISGQEQEVLHGLGAGMWGFWALNGDNLFYLQRTASGSSPAGIFRMDLNTGAKAPLGTTQFGVNESDKGLAVSPDGRWLLYAQRDVDRTNIMVAEGWQ